MVELPLFAYGTLLTGALDPAIDRLLARESTRLGPARIRGRLHDQGGYPGLVCDRLAGGWVRGELLMFSAPARVLAILDRYEGFDPARPGRGEFVRVAKPVARGSGAAMQDAWVYLLNTCRVRPGPRVVGGHWRTRQTR